MEIKSIVFFDTKTKSVMIHVACRRLHLISRLWRQLPLKGKPFNALPQISAFDFLRTKQKFDGCNYIIICNSLPKGVTFSFPVKAKPNFL